MWRWRRAFWDFFMVFKFRHARVLVIPAPSTPVRPIVPVPLSSKFPDLAIEGVMVADHVPSDEAQHAALAFCLLQLGLDRVASPMAPGLVQIDQNPQRALNDAYRPRQRRCFPAPERPAGYDPVIDLGIVAVEGPYSCYLERSGPGAYRWDLSVLADFETHAGLRSPAAVVEFSLDEPRRSLVATRIESELGSSSPGDRRWEESQRLALCAVGTHLSLVRHFNWLHLMTGGPLSFTVRNTLVANHPVRRLLQPHVYATHSSNQMVTIDQMARGGDFENIFSFTHDGMCRLFEVTCANADLRRFNPERDATMRGVSTDDLDMPAHENFLALFGVIRTHVRRYLDVYYPVESAIGDDAQLASWIAALAAYVPHGVLELAPMPLTIDGATQLLATLIYFTTVEHEVLGSGVWNYQLWPDVQPPRVYANGQRIPIDVYSRLVDANFTLNVARTPLMSDFSSLALDAGGVAAFEAFRNDLAKLQGIMDAEATTRWRIEPRRLKANINA